jgi:hypothetical protein
MKDFKKMPKMATGGAVSSTDQMYVPEKKFDEMYVPKKEQLGGMPTTTPAKKSEEFNLHKAVKKAADKSGMKRGGKVKK